MSDLRAAKPMRHESSPLFHLAEALRSGVSALALRGRIRVDVHASAASLVRSCARLLELADPARRLTQAERAISAAAALCAAIRSIDARLVSEGERASLLGHVRRIASDVSMRRDRLLAIVDAGGSACTELEPIGLQGQDVRPPVPASDVLTRTPLTGGGALSSPPGRLPARPPGTNGASRPTRRDAA